MAMRIKNHVGNITELQAFMHMLKRVGSGQWAVGSKKLEVYLGPWIPIWDKRSLKEFLKHFFAEFRKFVAIFTTYETYNSHPKPAGNQP
jgi:hypothetical protein